MCNKNVIKAARASIAATLIAATLSSFSLCLIPFASAFAEGESHLLSYIIAAVFWGGIIAIFVATFVTKRKLFSSREKLISEGRMKERQLIGIISFSGDRRMWGVYTVTVLGLVLIVTDIICGYVSEIVMFPVLSVTMLSFTAHCIFDGKYYKTYKLIRESVNNETNRET